MTITTTATEQRRPGDPSRAMYPRTEGYVERDGVRSFYEVYGDGSPTFLLLPTWSIVHSRFWKAQIPYLARHFRVVTFDGRGNGLSGRPQTPGAYNPNEFGDDALAVMDATGTASAIAVSASAGTLWNLYLAATQPDRVDGAVFIGPIFPDGSEWPAWTRASLHEPRASYEGAERYNLPFIREHLPEFAGWWAELCLPEPHSTMEAEYIVDWAIESDGDTIARTLGIAEMVGAGSMQEVFTALGDGFRAMADGIRCPVLVLQGELDVVTPPAWGKALASASRADYRGIPDSGHVPARKPVPYNIALRGFARRIDEEA